MQENSKSLESVALVGCTGLVGSHILSTVLHDCENTSIHALSRRALPQDSGKGADALKVHENSDTSCWAKIVTSLTSYGTSNPGNSHEKPCQVFISALGTTRAKAGGIEAQRKIDLVLNLELAQAAFQAGIKTYVLISATGTNKDSFMPYVAMKGQLEDAVSKIGFRHTVILKPGLLVGDRTERRPSEAIFRTLAKSMASVSTHLTDFWAQDADIVAKAAVSAAQQCVEGKREPGTWYIGQKDIVNIGRTEWKSGASQEHGVR